jgi:hypothetical protein
MTQWINAPDDIASAMALRFQPPKLFKNQLPMRSRRLSTEKPYSQKKAAKIKESSPNFRP